MKVERVHKSIRYTLSNENLKEGDKVFSIANGRCLEGNDWILHGFNWEEYCSGFPNEPHTIQKINDSVPKYEEVYTDHGHCPRECYYKIIKKEKQNKFGVGLGTRYEWVEFKD